MSSEQSNDAQANPTEIIPVNITIADRTYRVRIAPKDEEAVRKTAALINQKMVEYKNLYAGKEGCRGYAVHPKLDQRYCRHNEDKVTDSFS